ncbi:transposase [Azospirillum sp. A1-3]|uniref:transposase n=1 Tax=Azospirillum sp. A1-3 TaxID=185874 RepID=UPI0020770A89|nr:transposase [Azospirillum sp. A1-3]
MAVVPSPANVHDTKFVPDLLRLAQVVCIALSRLYAETGYDSADKHWFFLCHGVQPHISKIDEPHGSGQGKVRCLVEHARTWLQANKRLDRQQDRLGRINFALLTAAAIFIIANRLLTSENCPLAVHPPNGPRTLDFRTC